MNLAGAGQTGQWHGQPPAGRAARLLVVHIHTLVTMDDQRREIADGALLVEGPAILALGTTAELLGMAADEVLDLRGRFVVLPGLVNTHHHFCQVLTRAVAPDGTLFPWLKSLYPIWANLRADDIVTSARFAAAELALSGCTTTSDHLYILPNDCRIDDEIRGVQELGLRFTAVRGSMSIGESAGGLPPDSVVETEHDILADSQRLIETYHDTSRHAMLRVALGPCSPFTVSDDLMRESAALARCYPGVRLHTHLAENGEDMAYLARHHGGRPGEWAQALGWVGPDVWHAHCVQLNAGEIDLFARSGTGVAHCPCSNMRLASGAAPVRSMLDAGVHVGLGVDGSASNDTGNLLLEARAALLLARLREVDVAGMTTREALAIATRGGARCLGRDDIGHLAPGMSADFIAIDTERREFVGAHADPVAALLLCHNSRVDYSFVNGKPVVAEGHLVALDLDELARATREAAVRLASMPT